MRSVQGDRSEEHLSREDLARLVDEVASPGELRHLESCEQCMSELSALTAQTLALSELGDIEAPSGEWEAIEERLRVHLPSGAPSFEGRGSRPAPWIRVAAGVALFLAGGLTGATLAGGSGAPMASAPDPAPERAGVAPSGDLSLSESERLVGMAEDLYMDALLDYRQRVAQFDPALVARDPVGRLVMLENLLAATEAAVREAPADPFFNGVLATATAERRAVVAEMTALTQTTW